MEPLELKATWNRFQSKYYQDRLASIDPSYPLSNKTTEQCDACIRIRTILGDQEVRWLGKCNQNYIAFP